MIWNILAFLLVGILFLLGVLVLWSSGRLIPVVDRNGKPLAGSVSEKTHTRINGVEQGMIIKSKDRTHPVLLFVHGGPGMPTYFLNQKYPAGLEDCFTVCWWEQRGAGLSYSPSLPRETISVEQIVADTLAVTKTLRDRFGQEKIYLMGHSWGSFIGIQAAAQAPELYSAYIGVGQVTYQLKSECLAYEYMLQTFKQKGEAKWVRRLEAAPVRLTTPLPAAYDALRDDAMHGLGIGTTRDMKSVYTGIFLRSWLSREYTVREKINLWRGKFSSKAILWQKFLATDLTQQVTKLDIPAYFFHGKYDYTASYPLANDFFKKLQAPMKGFYTFEQSAHSPMHEEPGKMQQILREDVLSGKNSLADIVIQEG